MLSPQLDPNHVYSRKEILPFLSADEFLIADVVANVLVEMAVVEGILVVPIVDDEDVFSEVVVDVEGEDPVVVLEVLLAVVVEVIDVVVLDDTSDCVVL